MLFKFKNFLKVSGPSRTPIVEYEDYRCSDKTSVLSQVYPNFGLPGDTLACIVGGATKDTYVSPKINLSLLLNIAILFCFLINYFTIEIYLMNII